MAYQPVDIGSAPNDGTGDPIRDAFDKCNDNFVELYAGLVGLLDFKGSTDCSANPNYPAASKGDFYLVSVAGKIGGASGLVVTAGDSYFATADNAGGTQAGVGTSWTVIQGNINFTPVNIAGDTMTGDLIVPDEAYDATAWNGSLEVPTKNAIRDKIETFGAFTTASTTEVLTGTDSAKGATPDSLAALWEQGSDVASAGTTSLGEGGYFNITGTTTITDIDFATDKAGRTAWVKFAGAVTLTHNASTLILPTGANITTAAGDTACFISEGADAVRCVAYNRANGSGLRAGTAFPGSPATGDRFFRTDRGIEYYYDGTQWLSVQLFSLPIADNERLNTHSTTGAWSKAANPWNGLYSIYLVHAMLAYFISGTGNWTVTVTPNGNGSAFNSGAFSTSGAWTNINFGTPGTVFTSSLKQWETSVTENSGTATMFGAVVLVYRLVG